MINLKNLNSKRTRNYLLYLQRFFFSVFLEIVSTIEKHNELKFLYSIVKIFWVFFSRIQIKKSVDMIDFTRYTKISYSTTIRISCIIHERVFIQFAIKTIHDFNFNHNIHHNSVLKTSNHIFFIKKKRKKRSFSIFEFAFQFSKFT